tara:strand:- start:496 stop:684 length:189 start_codon:yes stop_codon:yes gene_type:complete
MPSGIVKLNNGDIMNEQKFKEMTLKALEALRDENKQALECTKIMQGMLEHLNIRIKRLEDKQ